LQSSLPHLVYRSVPTWQIGSKLGSSESRCFKRYDENFEALALRLKKFDAEDTAGRMKN
jgi:hypothetical protein